MVSPRVVAPHLESNSPLPLSGRDLGHGGHPLAAGCNRVGIGFVDRAASPATLKLATYSRLGVAQTVIAAATAMVDEPNMSVAGLDDDTFVGAWTDFDDDELGVRLRKIDPGASEQAAPVFANDEREFSQRSPDIAFDGSQVVVAWVDDSDAINGPDLRYRTFSTALEATSDDQTLAATGAVEDHVVLAATHGNWAAAWRSGSAGFETIEVQSGTAHWSVGPFLPGAVEDNPALAFVDAAHLVVAFTAGSDPLATGEADVSRLHGAILDTAFTGRVESFSIAPKVQPYAGLLGVSQLEPSIASYPDRLVVAWRSAAVPGAPEGDELWAREVWWAASGNSLLVDISSPEHPLLTSPEFRAGDQTRAVLLSSGNWPEHRLVSAWQDNNDSFKTLTGLPDVGVQFSRVPSELPATPAAGPCINAGLGLSPSTLAVPPASVALNASSNCGGAASAEYKFYYQGPDGGALHLIRDWGGPTSSWNTTALPSGRYTVSVYARRAGTSVAFDSFIGRGYFIGHVCNVNPIVTVTPPGLQPVGSTLSLAASATCNGTTPQYRFTYSAPGSSAEIDIGTWGTAPVSWNTTGLPSGTYFVRGYVRGLGNASSYESIGLVTAPLGDTCSVVNSFVQTPPSPKPSGTTVSLSATATCTGGTTPEFRYAYYLAGSPVQIGNWSASPVPWDTTGLPVNDYFLSVDARAVGNSSGSEAPFTGVTYTLQPGATCTVALTAPNSPISYGNSLSLSATASCGSNPTYQFAYLAPGGGGYTNLTSWGSTTSAVWNTTGLSDGDYDLAVFVRKSTTTSGYDGVQHKLISLRAKCIYIGFDVTPGAGSLLTLSGGASFCFDPVFSYFRAPADGLHSWTAIGSAWVTGSVSLDTSTIPPGQYELRVDAREGTLGPADLSTTVVQQIGPRCSLEDEQGSLTGHPQAPGTILTFAAGDTLTCDEGVTPEYSFYYRPPGGTDYILFADWQTDPSADLDTTDFPLSGTYDYQILVRGVGHVGSSESVSHGTFAIE